MTLNLKVLDNCNRNISIDSVQICFMNSDTYLHYSMISCRNIYLSAYICYYFILDTSHENIQFEFSFV